MKRIYKYELKVVDGQFINIQSNNILSVQEQDDKIIIYAVIDTEMSAIKYEFGINGTGNPISFDIDDFNFLGTVKMYDGKLMFHVFYRKVE